MPVIETLIVPAGKVASTLTNFPVRVDLSHMAAAWWTDTTSDLGNVRVKSGGSVVPFDVVSYDRTAKTGELFFKNTLTTSANTFTIETVSGATALPATDTNGRNNVWVDYLAVVLAADTINRVNGNSPAATAGTITNSTTGLFTFDGTQRITFTVTKPTTWTMGFSGASTVLDTSGVSRGALQVNTESQVGDGDREVLGIRDTTGNDPWGLWNTTDSWLVSTADVTLSRERIHAQHNGTTSRTIWRGGVLDATDNTVVAKPSNTGTAFQIAGRNGDTGAQRWVGTIGYMYLRNSLLSADWLAAETLSWETPSSFYSVIHEETGSLAATVPHPVALALSGAYSAPPTGALAAVLPKPTLALAGDYTPPPNPTGSLDARLPVTALALTGEYREAGALAATTPKPVLALAGAYVAPPSGSLALTLPVPALALAGDYTLPSHPVGDLYAVLPVPHLALVGSYIGPELTDVSNDFDGLDMGGYGVVTITVPATAPSATAPAVVNKAIPLPLPVLVKGRET